MKKRVIGNIIFLFLLISTIIFLTIYLYNSYFVSQNYILSLKKQAILAYLQSDKYSAYSKTVANLNKVIQILLIGFIPIFVISSYFTLKYFSVIKKEKKHKLPYYISIIAFIILLLNYIFSNNNYYDSQFIGIFVYITNCILKVISVYILIPLTVVTTRYAILYFLEKYNKDIERIARESKRRKLEQRIKDAEEKLKKL